MFVAGIHKIKIMKIYSIIIIFCISFLPLSAQVKSDSLFESHIQQGIQKVYNFEFEEAEKEFQILTVQKPKHPAGYFFLAMVDWWKILLDIDNETLDKQFLTKLDKVISICDDLLDENDNDVDALFFKGGALGFRGRLYANRESWVKAANDGREALPIVQRAYSLAPKNYDVLLGIGIYNYYAEVIPETFPVVKPLMLFFPSGDKKKGIKQLEAASQKSKYASIEAQYFLLQLYYNYERQFETAIGYAQTLFQKFPNNALFQRYVGRCFVGVGRWEEAKAIFADVKEKCAAQKRGYTKGAEREASYYLATYQMLNNDSDMALQNFYRCDELSRTLDKEGASGFMSMANLKIGMIYDAQMKREYAVKQYNKVLQMKNFETTHEQAKKYLQTPYKK